MLLGFTIIASLGFSGWSVITLGKVIDRSYHSIAVILEDLKYIKFRFKEDVQNLKLYTTVENNLTNSPDNTPGPVITPHAVLLERIGRLADNPRFAESTSTGAARTFGESTRKLAVMLQKCATTYKNENPDSFNLQVKQTGLYYETLNTYLDKIEEQLLANMDLSFNYMEDVRVMLGRVLLFCFLAALLSGFLAWLLFRRWVINPILTLRKATTELSAGNFEYRIAIDTNDEFGTLSDEVNYMAMTIVEIQNRLVERERMAAVGEMLRRLVHNLRNPLAGIRSLAEITRDDMPANSEHYETQQRIVLAVDRFESWLKDMLFSTTPLNCNLQQDSPETLLRNILESHQPMASSKGINIKLVNSTAPDYALFDRRHLEQAVVALVANAIESAPANGQVMITASQETNSKFWKISVDDSGNGVPPDIVDKVTRPYFTTKSNGTGIGLALVQNVTQAHNGRLEINRSTLGGACFTLILPC